MTATPAWPPRSTPRLFVDDTLTEGRELLIAGGQAHYLATVMRCKIGDPVRVFDDRTGEWLALVSGLGKRDLTLGVSNRLRPRDAVPDLWLCFAPIKKGRIDLIAEKACELGAAVLQPVVTRRTIIDKVKTDRLRANLIEAAEQCDRTALPELRESVALARLLKDWPAGRRLYFADELGGEPLAQACRGQSGPSAILIGPEGGFDDEERAAIRALADAVPVTLGPRILRAETAGIAALSVWMAEAGDWS